MKFFCILFLVCLTAFLPASKPALLALPATLLIGIAWFVHSSPRQIAKRLLILEPFLLAIFVLTFFQGGGVEKALFLIAKATISLFGLVVLGTTTSFGELIRTMKVLRLPVLLTTTIALMVRYFSVLIEEATRMKQARASRTFVEKRRFEWATLATVLGQLVIRTLERSERVYSAMCARGWDVTRN